MIITLLTNKEYNLFVPLEATRLVRRLSTLSIEEKSNIASQIEQEKYVTSVATEIYRKIKCPKLTSKQFEDKYLLEFNQTHVKHDYFIDYEQKYTYITAKKRFYRLTEVENDNPLEFALITKLLYEYKRHGWNDDPCLTIRLALNKLIPNSFHKKIKYFQNKLTKYEAELHDYVGDYLSEDSDSDEEDNVSTNDRVQKAKTASKYIAMAKPNKFFNKVANKADLAKKIKVNNFNIERVEIPRPANFSTNNQAKVDLDKINDKLRAGEIITPAFLSTLATTFCVAQYRGIHYSITLWDAEMRRKHRVANELKKPQFSGTVFKSLGIKNARDYREKIKNDSEFEEKAIAEGEVRQNALLSLQYSPAISHAGYVFANPLYLLQQWYSSNYDLMPDRLAAEFKKQNSIFKAVLPNNMRPFVSTGNFPYHALRYAYGLKYYDGQELNRLRPCWRRSGQAERPYSGKFYLSLHPIEDYSQRNPCDVPSLFNNGLVVLDNQISPERETTFLGYLPKDRVVLQHLAKYPSFHGDYKKIYHYKYGLLEQEYIAIKAAFEVFKPHSLERRNLILLLGEYLCAFQEARMIAEAQRLALAQQHVLIYRDENGGFSFKPSLTPSTASKLLKGQIMGNRNNFRNIAPAVNKSEKVDKVNVEIKQFKKSDFMAGAKESIKDKLTIARYKYTLFDSKANSAAAAKLAMPIVTMRVSQ